VTPHRQTWLIFLLAAICNAIGCSAKWTPTKPGRVGVAASWTPSRSMSEPRYQHSITRLMSGDILVAGGRTPVASVETNVIRSAEVYRAKHGIWSTAGSMRQARAYHAATLLNDGRVLVTGGINLVDGVLDSVELFWSHNLEWTAGAPMHTARREHTATLLRDESVLVAGGQNGSPLRSAEVFDPRDGHWRRVGDLANARQSASAALLPNGRVLVAGGVGQNRADDYLDSAEIYDPVSKNWSVTGALAEGRDYTTLTPLRDGRVIAIGGRGSAGALSSMEVYDTRGGSWIQAGRLRVPRYDHRVVVMPSGVLMVIGGLGSDDRVLDSVELIDPIRFISDVGPRLSMPRYGAGVTTTTSGRVVVTGGAQTLSDASTIYASSEILFAGSHIARLAPSIGSVRREPGYVIIIGHRFTDYLQRSGGGFQNDSAVAPVITVACEPTHTTVPTAAPGQQYWSDSEVRLAIVDTCPDQRLVVTLETPSGAKSSASTADVRKANSVSVEKSE